MSHYRIYRLLAIGWMGVIFFLSSKSKLPVQSFFSGQDKLAHLLAFGILGFLFARSLRLERKEFSFKHVLFVSLLVAVYGAFDETHQLFVPGREASIIDLVADILGGFIAGVMFWKL